MRLFLDTSVLLAASGSDAGASREIFRRASANDWILVTTPYAIEEVLRNLADLPPSASADWARLRPALLVMDDVLTLDRPTVFPVGKDRPILFSEFTLRLIVHSVRPWRLTPQMNSVTNIQARADLQVAAYVSCVAIAFITPGEKNRLLRCPK